MKKTIKEILLWLSVAFAIGVFFYFGMAVGSRVLPMELVKYEMIVDK